MLAFYQALLQQPGPALFWFNVFTIGLLATGVAEMIRYEVREEELPKNLIYALIILGLFVAVLHPGARPNLNASLLGMALAGVMFLWVRLLSQWFTGATSIGFDEVKFAATAGLWVGLPGLVPLLLAGFAFALVAFVVVFFVRKARNLPQFDAFPFSPVLGGATLMIVLLDAFGPGSV